MKWVSVICPMLWSSIINTLRSTLIINRLIMRRWPFDPDWEPNNFLEFRLTARVEHARYYRDRRYDTSREKYNGTKGFPFCPVWFNLLLLSMSTALLETNTSTKYQHFSFPLRGKHVARTNCGITSTAGNLAKCSTVVPLKKMNKDVTDSRKANPLTPNLLVAITRGIKKLIFRVLLKHSIDRAYLPRNWYIPSFAHLSSLRN